MKPLKHVVGLIVLLFLFLPQTRAEDCENLLDRARDAFFNGLYQDTLSLVTPCLEDLDYRFTALEWCARAYIMLDRWEDAQKTIRLMIDINPLMKADPGAPYPFGELLNEAQKARRESQLNEVTSVSKFSEDISDAPASVIVLTAEELFRRGYTDLEQVFHDLPGFDITTGNGELYANIYPRGYRTDRNTQMLLRFDGIEQNDLYSGTYYLSRQYPLSVIDKIVVAYGPLSSVYGSNAYVGVIDVLTRDPRTMLGADRKLVTNIRVNGGSFATRSLDFNLAGAIRDDFSWQIYGRRFTSDEPDAALNEREEEDGWDETRNWFIAGKLSLTGVTLGFQSWRRMEGTAPWYTDHYLGDAAENRMTPTHQTFFLDYKKVFHARTTLSFNLRYKEHRLDQSGTTNSHVFSEYRPAEWWQLSTQTRVNLEVTHRLTRNWQAFAGVELRKTRLPSGLNRCDDENPYEECFLLKPNLFEGINDFDDRDIGIYSEVSGRIGKFEVSLGGRYDDNVASEDDFSFGSTFSPRFSTVYLADDYTLKLIYSQAYRNPAINDVLELLFLFGEFGSYLFPGAANRETANTEIVALKKFDRFYVEASVYRSRYTEELTFANENLVEANINEVRYDIKGFQALARWQGERTDIYANYNYIEPFAEGSIDILGSGETLEMKTPIGDIARNRFNIGINRDLGRFFDLNLRANYVGKRESGEGTTVISPGSGTSLHDVPDYLTLAGALTLRTPIPEKFGKLDLQLIGKNLTDTEYAHPGVRWEDDMVFNNMLIQPGRTLYFRVRYRH